MAAQDADLRPIVASTVSAESGQTNTTDDPMAVDQSVDTKWLELVLADAERAEQNWRRRGRQIVSIYRNDDKSQGIASSPPASSKPKRPTGNTFNILFANTEVMLPSLYQQPPTPVVKSRFTAGSMPAPQPPPLPMGLTAVPPMGPPPAPIGMPVPPGGGGLPPVAEQGQVPNLPGLPPAPVPGPRLPFGLPVPPANPMAAPLGMMSPAPGRPAQKDIETAAAVMEKTLEIVLSDEGSNMAIRTAIKDVLLPGRGVCRVRWKPVLVDKPPVGPLGGDGPLTAGPSPDGATPSPVTQKVWEEVGDEYVYWEDLLVDPVRQANDMQWVAFRHLFTADQLKAEFTGNPAFDQRVAAGRVDTLLQWTEESAAKSPPSGGGGYSKTAEQKGDAIKKAMVWEFWDKVTRRIIWYIRETGGLVLRVDPDSLDLQGFFPIPAPLLAITTSDSRIPKAFYDLYANLAEDLEECSQRISMLTKQIKVRGGYNSASNEIADILRAGDQKMIPVEGVDMLNGGLNSHIWLVPIDAWVGALEKLIAVRAEIKQSIYEIMGISDIMRGATKASETATAQRIKGTMGTVRLSDQRDDAAQFALDLMRLKAEIIAKNFDQSTLERMTGEAITPEVLAILRSDFQRTCSIDIETDSTVAIDEQQEQQSMAQIMQAIQAVMMGAQGMLATGILPGPQVILLSLEMMEMALHPVRYSRGVVQLINQFKDQLIAQMMAPPPPMPPPGMAPPPGQQPHGPGAPPPPTGSPARIPGPPGPPIGRANGGAVPPPPHGNNTPPGMPPPMPH